MEDTAATKLQGIFRGRQVRMKNKEPEWDSAPLGLEEAREKVKDLKSKVAPADAQCKAATAAAPILKRGKVEANPGAFLKDSNKALRTLAEALTKKTSLAAELATANTVLEAVEKTRSEANRNCAQKLEEQRLENERRNAELLEDAWRLRNVEQDFEALRRRQYNVLCALHRAKLEAEALRIAMSYKDQSIPGRWFLDNPQQEEGNNAKFWTHEPIKPETLVALDAAVPKTVQPKERADVPKRGRFSLFSSPMGP